jgi:hypothetical protein
VPAAAGNSGRLFRNLEACKVNALLTPANYGPLSGFNWNRRDRSSWENRLNLPGCKACSR